METSVILFGASGDLAQGKLFPALFHLCGSSSNTGFDRIVAVGRRPYSREEFVSQLENDLRSKGLSEENLGPFLSRVFYYQMDLLSSEDYQKLDLFLEKIENDEANRLYYLAVPPESYTQILQSLSPFSMKKKGGWRRIVIEKPFGSDQASAGKLNDHIAPLFNEDQVYRIDHYLGKETVQNLLAFRFANRIIEPLWSKDHIDHIQITVSEEEGIKNRGGYYDSTGAFRDLVQNHILQLLAFLTMEQPSDFSFDELSERKNEILRQTSFDPGRTVFGQYEGYLSESKVAPESKTETYAMTSFLVDTPRWKGVPFYIRTGKALARRVSEISIQFKKTDQSLFSFTHADQEANVLTFRLQPDEGIDLSLGIKTPRSKMRVQPVHMEFCYGTSFSMSLPDAYELLFQDVLEGNQTHSLRADTISESWRIVDDILATKEKAKLHPYAVSSWGPEEADTIMAQDGRRWLAHENLICNGIRVEPLSHNN
jgi:glucose-6-phosphate 1-dehydrogenase